MPDSSRAPPRRLTASGPAPVVGLLVDCLEDNYHWAIVRGAMDAARDRGAHLLCFAGGPLSAPPGEGGERNVVFDLARPASVDALVVMSGAIGNRIGPARLLEYCARFHPLPMCSIAVELEGLPSVCIDNEAGMRLAIDHLIHSHGKRRIAFIRGPVANAEAERRFAVYRLTLAAAGLPLADELIAAGDFAESGGRDAVQTLLTERGLLARGLDAIVAANDAMALGALQALSSLGIAVPDQVAVIGFDDVEEARFASPPLTTVRQPLYEQGRAAVRVVLDKLAGGSPEERVVRSTPLGGHPGPVHGPPPARRRKRLPERALPRVLRAGPAPRGRRNVSSAFVKASLLFEAFEGKSTEFVPYVLASNDVGVRSFAEVARGDVVEPAFLPLLDRLGLPKFQALVRERFVQAP